MRCYGLISNFGVNSFSMSASSELEPHPRCPEGRLRNLIARRPGTRGARFHGEIVPRLRLETDCAKGLARRGFTTG